MALEEKKRLEEEEERLEAELLAKEEAEEASLQHAVIQEQQSFYEESKDTSIVTLDLTAEEMVAKNDEIEQLKDQLELSKQQLHDQQKLVADVREELQIKEGIYQQAQGERDTVQSKLKEFVFKIQQLQENLSDKEETLH